MKFFEFLFMGFATLAAIAVCFGIIVGGIHLMVTYFPIWLNWVIGVTVASLIIGYVATDGRGLS